MKYEEKQFYQRQIIENKNNLRKVWAVIKQVINRNKNSKISDQFIINNKTETDPMMIAKDSITTLQILAQLLPLK